MPSWKNMRFQTKLLAFFILLSGIPTLLLGTIAYQKSSSMFLDRTEQDLNVILAQLNTSVERQISDFDRFTMLPYYLPDIFSFLNKPAVSPDQWGSSEINAQKTMARMMAAYPSINSSINGLMIYGMNGSINGYRINGNTTIKAKENVKDDAWYEEVIARKGGLVITGVQEVKQFNGVPFQAIIVSRLLMDEDYHPLGVIAIFISPDFIPKIVRSLELPTVQVTVLDRNRRLIYASDMQLAERLGWVADGGKGSWESELPLGRGGTKYSGVYLQSGYLGWKIYMGVNRDEMLKGSRTIRNFTLIIAVVIVFVAAAVSWLLARGLSKPIYRLIRSMRAVEKGNFAVPVAPEREDEIGQLESSYGRMVHRLDELIQSIEEKERQKRHAELYALRARIQPHFLYNTLNSIRMLAILQQSTQIAKLIQSLNRLLHANMKLDSELVSLEEEIRLLHNYVVLMDLRYTNVFEVDWRIEGITESASVPPMLLQPILENAIFHGAKGLDRKLNIIVTSQLSSDRRLLFIEIADDGAGFRSGSLAIRDDGGGDANADADSTHIGLRNVRDRIRLRFGDEFGLSIGRDGVQTRVILKMPYKPLNKEDEGNVESARR